MTSAVGAAQNPLPRRIILSRKGLDSKAGGLASPILVDRGDALLSLPIPDCGTGTRYEHLRSPHVIETSIGAMLNDLSGDEHFNSREVHLDPDLREDAVERSEPFRPAFGQCGTEQTHLENEPHGGNAGENTDLFLFFGYFRKARYDKTLKRWKYVRGKKLHVIHSWMQVGNATRIVGPSEDWSKHPHGIPSFLVRTDQQRRSAEKRNNTIYTPRDRLTFKPSIPGHGVFPAVNPDLQITDPNGRNRTDWRLPTFFRDKLSHFGKAEWCQDSQYCYVTQKGYGQEFILNVLAIPHLHQQVRDWLMKLPFCAPAQRPVGSATTLAQRASAGKG